jgi:potassium efflux system protein
MTIPKQAAWQGGGMDGQDMIEQGRAWAEGAWAAMQGWLTSPAFWTQAALLLASWLLAVWASRRLKPRIRRFAPPVPAAAPSAPRLWA